MKNNDYEIDDQKRIGRREFLEIEDKGLTDAEKRAAAAAVEDEIIAQPVRKKSWAGWWAAALFFLAIIGCCIYFSTRDGRELERRADVSDAASTASKKISGAASDAYAKASDAVSNVADKVSGVAKEAAGKVAGVASSAKEAVVELAGADVYAKYPIASDDLISQEAADGRKVDYLYYFANDQSQIPDNEVLNDIAEAAKNTDAKITITAYASASGSASYNEALCEKRAENLENYLVAHGVDADNISIEKGGQTAQFGDDAYNRRADILVNYAG